MSNKLNIKFNRDFTVLPNQIMKDSRISFKAKGIWCQLISLPEGWGFSISGLAALAKESEKAIKSGLDELIEFGYLEWRKTRNEKNQFTVEVNVFLPEPYAETLHGKTSSGQNALWRNADNKESNNKELNSNKELTNNKSVSSKREDPVWDALMEAFSIEGPIPGPERGRYNKVVSELKKIGATPEEILERREHYRIYHAGLTQTPMGLLNNWGLCTREQVNQLTTAKQRDKMIDAVSEDPRDQVSEQRTFEFMVAKGYIDEYGNPLERKELL